MIRKLSLPAHTEENGDALSGTLPPDKRLQHLRSVTTKLMREALDVWAEIWGEFQDRVTPNGVLIPPEGEKGFEPRCGWPEFLERMWLLRYYLGLVKKLSDEDR
jgi:hypothetical protein